MKESLFFVPADEIERIRAAVDDPFVGSALLADVFRINILYMIMRAGSGHLGSSFSSIDILTWLWTREMRHPNEIAEKGSDLFFSSKGHDVPALYAVLTGFEKLNFDLIHSLRRLNGLPGHPDVETPYVITNTGPLGMGISKARGMAMARRLNCEKGKIYVLTGDGELQEGQFWESLQPAANGKFSEIVAIVDHNKIQSDKMVTETSDLGRLEDKLRAFGWEVARCDGHDHLALSRTFRHFASITDRPQILIADTVKGKGVSFMETLADDGSYKFHSGAPSYEQYARALSELSTRIDARFSAEFLPGLRMAAVEAAPRRQNVSAERLVGAYGDELVKIGAERNDVVVLDADLAVDCGLLPFKNAFPDRFVECGIAEQDMVSVAGGLALSGKLPIVHSFACFLSTRPNEQIYNNATERRKIIYTGSLAGLLPAAPGHSHQSIRDIDCLGSIPGLMMVQPSCEQETRAALRWAVRESNESVYIRLVSLPCALPFVLPQDHVLTPGRGTFLRAGDDAVIIGYGPVMLGEAFKAAESLGKRDGLSLAVINLPWLNYLDERWFDETLNKFGLIFTLDDHYAGSGQGALIASAVAGRQLRPLVRSFGIEGIPACGSPDEVLRHHGLDGASLAERIKSSF